MFIKNQQPQPTINEPGLDTLIMSAPLHRVITGHSSTGKAIITHDDILQPVDLMDNSKLATDSDFGITLLYRTESDSNDHDKTADSSTAAFSVSNTVPFQVPYQSRMPVVEPGHANWRIVDFPAGSTAPMHRTTSVDFGLVLKGEIVLELDDGVEKVLTEHSGIVQRGTIHAWHNRTTAVTRMVFMILPSETIVVNGQELADVPL